MTEAFFVDVSICLNQRTTALFETAEETEWLYNCFHGNSLAFAGRGAQSGCR